MTMLVILTYIRGHQQETEHRHCDVYDANMESVCSYTGFFEVYRRVGSNNHNSSKIACEVLRAPCIHSSIFCRYHWMSVLDRIPDCTVSWQYHRYLFLQVNLLLQDNVDGLSSLMDFHHFDFPLVSVFYQGHLQCSIQALKMLRTPEIPLACSHSQI